LMAGQLTEPVALDLLVAQTPPAGRLELARLLADHHQPERARSCLEAVAAEARDAATLVAIGTVYHQLQQPEAATALYERALPRLDEPDRREIRLRLFRAWGGFTKLSATLPLRPNPLQDQRLAGVLQALTERCEREPMVCEAHLALGDLRLLARDRPLARQSYRAALAAATTPAQRFTAWLALADADPLEAWVARQVAVDLYPAAPEAGPSWGWSRHGVAEALWAVALARRQYEPGLALLASLPGWPADDGQRAAAQILSLAAGLDPPPAPEPVAKLVAEKLAGSLFRDASEAGLALRVAATTALRAARLARPR